MISIDRERAVTAYAALPLRSAVGLASPATQYFISGCAADAVNTHASSFLLIAQAAQSRKHTWADR